MNLSDLMFFFSCILKVAASLTHSAGKILEHVGHSFMRLIAQHAQAVPFIIRITTSVPLTPIFSIVRSCRHHNNQTSSAEISSLKSIYVERPGHMTALAL